MMSTVKILLLAAVPALVLWHIVQYIVTEVGHARRAEAWGCKPAYVRPYRLPFGLDIVGRILSKTKEHELQNDDEVVFEEMGRRETWNQQLLGQWIHYTVDHENVKAMLATQFDDFALGPVRRGVFAPFLGAGIFVADGEAWEHARALLRPQFVRTQIGNLELKERHLQIFFERNPVRSNGWTDEIDLNPLLTDYMLDTTTEFLFGESVNAQQTAPDSHSGDVGKFDLKRFSRAYDAAVLGCRFRLRFGSLYWMYNPKSFRDACKEVHTVVDAIVDRALTGNKPVRKENTYVMVYELAKETQDRTQVRDQLNSLLLAGRDTTSGLIAFILWYLSKNPGSYERLRNEILEHFGTSPEGITFESLKACTYLQHVISEVLRLEAPAPENRRSALRNTTLPRGGGPDGMSPIYIRKGAQVQYNVRLMQRRKAVWGEDADQYNPDRWRGLKAGWEFTPFSGGPRICVGQQFALTQAAYMVVRILQKYDRVENGSSERLKHRHGLSIAPSRLPLRFHEAAFS